MSDANAQKYEATAMQLSDQKVMARIVGKTSTPLVQSDISAIAYSWWRDSTPQTEEGNGTLNPVDVIYNELQGCDPNPDPDWTKDNVGYNFGWAMPGSIFALPIPYTISVRFTIGVSPNDKVISMVFGGPTIRTQAG